MRSLRFAVIVGLVAMAAMVVGCGDTDTSSKPDDNLGTEANASTKSDSDRAESHVAFKVSGMKKTVSGAT